MSAIFRTLFIVFCLVFSAPVEGQQSALGSLSGNIRVGTNPSFRIDRADIFANLNGTSTTKLVFLGAHTGSYQLSLSVPSSPALYQINSELHFNAYRSRIRFPAKPVSIEAGGNSVHDIVLDQPGFIQGTVQVQGGTISSATVAIERADGSSLSLANVNTQTLQYSVPVVPGSQLQVKGTASLTTGASITLPTTNITVLPGETKNVHLVAEAPAMGSFMTSIQLPGESAVDQFRIQLSGPGGRTLFVPSPDGSSVVHRVDNLAVGSYLLSVRALLGGGDDELWLPPALILPAPSFLVTAGSERSTTLSSVQSRIWGALSVSGTIAPEDIVSGQVLLLGDPRSAAAGGQSSDRLAVAGLQYDNIVTAGSWYADSIRLQLERPDARGYLKQTLQFRDERAKTEPIRIGAGELVQQNFSYRFSSRRFEFSAPSGTLISSPTVSANCVKRSADGKLLWSFTAVSSSPIQNVAHAAVELVALDGICSFVTEARIGGANLNLGSGTVEFVAGSAGIIDAGGPSIRGISIEPGMCTGLSTIGVAGFATDDVLLQSVKVNDSSAVLTPGVSLNDPVEVQFSAVVPLILGTNSLRVVALDQSGKAAVDVREVTRSSDTDGDSVLDCFDGCDEDPAKVESGLCGCGKADVDSDLDGSLDCNDGCPTDSNKVQPSICGCGVSDQDTDLDGLADCVDLCPADPAKSNSGVCGCGVADRDSDGDGSFDCRDLCAADPQKQELGVCGCGNADSDSDGDSVPDCVDGCAIDPGKAAPAVCGCGIPDTDADLDGVPDCIDECAFDALKSQAGMCGCGVSDADSDGDGIPDCQDLCPADPLKSQSGVCGCGSQDLDQDGDGVYVCEGDCNDQDAKTYPGAPEVCGDPDLNCDGVAKSAGSIQVSVIEDYVGVKRSVPGRLATFEIHSTEPSSCAQRSCGRVPSALRGACLAKHCVPSAIASTSEGLAELELEAGKYVVLAVNSPFNALSSEIKLECGTTSGAAYYRVSVVTPKKVTPIVDWFVPGPFSHLKSRLKEHDEKSRDDERTEDRKDDRKNDRSHHGKAH